MRSAEEFNNVKRLVAAGMKEFVIARPTGITPRTVPELRVRPLTLPRHTLGVSDCGIDHNRASLAAAPYCYLLGLYLGDGCISRHQRAFSLRISLDTKYPAIIERCRQAIDILMPTQHAGVLRRSDGCSDV